MGVNIPKRKCGQIGVKLNRGSKCQYWTCIKLILSRGIWISWPTILLIFISSGVGRSGADQLFHLLSHRLNSQNKPINLRIDPDNSAPPA